MLETRMSVDLFAKKQKGSFPELVGEVEVEKSEFDPILEKYEEAKACFESWIKAYAVVPYGSISHVTEAYNFISRLELDVLTPAQIDLAFQHIIENDKYEGELHFIAGRFLSKLIQDSYDAGYNNFALTLGNKQFDNPGRDLKGRPDNPLQIIFTGSMGKNCGTNSQYTAFFIHGDVGAYCGSYSVGSNFTIYGSTDHSCGFHSKEGTFLIERNMGDDGGSSAKRSLFEIQGNAGSNLGQYSESNRFLVGGSVQTGCGYKSRKNEYITSNELTYASLKKIVPKRRKLVLPTKNKVIFQP